MLKRVRRSSGRVTLVLIGAATVAATLSGCQKEDIRRDVYASKADCLADWGNKPTDCEPAHDRRTGNAATTHYYGRPYSSGGANSSPSRTGNTIGSTSTSRSGFGSSGLSASG